MATQKSTNTKNPVAKTKNTAAKKTTTNSLPKTSEVVVEEKIQPTLEQVQAELNSIKNDPENIVNCAMSIDFADFSSLEELEDSFEESKETILNEETSTTAVEEDRYYKNVSP